VRITLTNSGIHRATDLIVEGYTTRLHLLLDFDHKSLAQVAGLCRLIQESWPETGDCLIMESSKAPPGKVTWIAHTVGVLPIADKANYHAVFDGLIGYDSCTKIIVSLVELDVLDFRYREIRKFRGDMTLRVSKRVESRRTIPAPKIVLFLPSPFKYYAVGGISMYLERLSTTNTATFK